jgi:2Fe-2S ferredoxin
MTQLFVTDRDGRQHGIKAHRASTLMEALRNENMGVAAICGGMLSCGTCHVYLDSSGASLGVLPASEDEAALAAGLRHYIEGLSRIACQIPLKSLDTLRVTVAPEE